MVQILDDERQEPVVAGGCERKQGESIGGLMSEKAETCFVLPLREAVAHFARRNT
jgi:hypothetical protein